MAEIKYKRSPNIDELENEFCSYFINKMNGVFDNGKKQAVVMLSGGKTPLGFYKKLSLAVNGIIKPAGENNYCQSEFPDLKIPGVNFDFGKITFLLGDERNVSENDSESNFGNIVKNLCGGVIGKKQLLPVTNGFEIPAVCSRRYDELIKKNAPGGVIDLLVLGIGDDGHTASLFPWTIYPVCVENHLISGIETSEKKLCENSRHASIPLFISHYVPGLSSVRFTITEEVIINAGNIAVILTGKNKIRAVDMINDKKLSSAEVPAKLIFKAANRGVKKEVTFFTDMDFEILF